MRALVAILVCGLATPAAAGPKPLPPKLAKAASAAFAAAQAADKKGDLDAAWKQYERAIAIAPHPSTYFNLADVQVRSKSVLRAIRSYEEYLDLAPDAADRKAIEKRIVELRELKGIMELRFSEGEDGLVFVDGVPKGKETKVTMRGGTYHVDIITPITHGDGSCESVALRTDGCNLGGSVRTDGNVVIGSSWTWIRTGFHVGDQSFSTKGRFPVRPGTYALKIHDRQCAPLKLVVPPGDVLTYAFITYPEKTPDDPKACLALTITQRRVTFD